MKKFNIRTYKKMLEDNNIFVIYSGPIWEGSINGMAEMLIKRLEYEDLPLSASQSVFSIFVEQMTNMLRYSEEKVICGKAGDESEEISKGTFVLSIQGYCYIAYSVNTVTDKTAENLKQQIDYLNTLDKKALRKFQKKRLIEGHDNLDSKGAGVGLIEIARRATAPLEYEFTPAGEGKQNFSLYIVVEQQEGGGE
jgi:hypothetical protein